MQSPLTPRRCCARLLLTAAVLPPLNLCRYFWTLPQQLWPYMQHPVFAYDVVGHTATPSLAAPTSGVWQAGQAVLAALNSSAAAKGRGWRCTAGGKPGQWVPFE
jgi:hypothetical protein